jgi:hypothetical protein
MRMSADTSNPVLTFAPRSGAQELFIRENPHHPRHPCSGILFFIFTAHIVPNAGTRCFPGGFAIL